MNYLYKFDKEECWYKDVCPLYDDKCSAGCVRFLKMHFLANNALLTKKQQHPASLIAEPIDKESFIKLNNIKKDIKNYVDKGNNLLIHSKITGNGKTEWCLKLLMSYFDKIWAEDDFTVRGLFVSVPRLFNCIRENIDENSDYFKHIKSNFYEADIVVWDEIGLKTLTPFEHQYLLNFINDRITNGKCNIFTSNLNTDELLNTLGDRLFSRIVNASDVVELKGSDKRGLK